MKQIFLMDGNTRVFDATLEEHYRPAVASAGVERHIYEPEELGIEAASELISSLEHAAEYTFPNAPNLHVWFGKYLKACRDNPNATVSVTVMPDPPPYEEVMTPKKR